MSGACISEVPAPDYIVAFDDSDWRYYVSGHESENVLVIDEVENLEWAPVWMRPTRTSTLDEMERPEGVESVTRDKRGRFVPTYCWLECSESHPDARPFLGVRYR